MQNKKWLSFFLALLVAVGLWVYVVTVENPEGEEDLYNIPVIFSGEDLLREDYELIIAGDNVTASGVKLTFSGKRTELKKLAEHKNEMNVTIDVTRIRKANNYTYSYSLSDITLPASVASDSVSLIDRYPGTISLTVQKIDKRTIPVKVLVNVKMKDGYIHDRVVQDFTELTIEGPEELVSQIKQGQVILERENVDKTLVATLPITLIDKNDAPVDSPEITYDFEELEVTLPVRMTKDVPLDVNFIAGGGASEDDVIYSIDPPMLTLSGDASVLQSINSIKLANIDLSTLMSNTDKIVYQIPIPEGCNNISGITEATVSIKISNKTILNIRTSNIQILNPPEGLNPISKVAMLLVTIRVDSAKASLITADNVRVIADMSDITIPEDAVSVTVPVDIYVDGVENVGAIGSEYSIVVELQSPEENSQDQTE
jgi:hypothetical protein